MVAISAESVLGQMDHLGASVSVLKLDDVDVRGADPRGLEGRARRVERGSGSLLDGQPGAVDLERAQSPGAHRGGAEIDGRVGVAPGVLRPA